MTATEFLINKGLIKKGYTKFIIEGDFKKIELTQLLEEYHKTKIIEMNKYLLDTYGKQLRQYPPKKIKNTISYSDQELTDMINEGVEHYKRNGDSHYIDTNDDRILEIYWLKIVDRIIDSIDQELTDDDIEEFVERLSNL